MKLLFINAWYSWPNSGSHLHLTLRRCHRIIILTHWGRVTHICVDKLTNIGSDNGLSPGRRQAIIWTNAGILLIRPLGTNFNEMLIEILTFSFMKTRLNCLGLNVLITIVLWENSV